jgi:hypothetical protein
MPKYYLTIEKPENMEDPWSTPPTYGFAFLKDAEKLHPGDMMVDYVSREWGGFAIVMKVAEWSSGVACKYDRALGSTADDFPYRVRVEVLCEIKEPRLVPKWQELRPRMHWCAGMTQAGANQSLRQPLREIDRHDYDLISSEVCNRAGSATTGSQSR